MTKLNKKAFSIATEGVKLNMGNVLVNQLVGSGLSVVEIKRPMNQPMN